MRRHTPSLDALATMLQRLESGQTRAEPQLDEHEQTKLSALARTGRRLLAPGRGMGLAFTRYARVELAAQTRTGRFDATRLLAAGLEGLRAHVLLRLRSGGNDESFSPLKPATIEQKTREGAPYPELPGYRTGDLYRAIARATWRLVR